MSSAAQPIAILVAALGGQGGGVLAEWLVEVAGNAGHAAQSTSIPGVAQRTGATTYYVEICPVAAADLGGRSPVLSLLPVPGAIDLLVASEALEAARMVQAGMASAERTVIIASTSRVLTTAEKIPLGDGRYDGERLREVVRAHARRVAEFDMDAAGRTTGTALSAVMLGAIAASGVLAFPREAFERVIRDSGLGVAASLAGFAAGFAAVAGGRGGRDARAAAPAAPDTGVPGPVAARLPAAAHELAGEGYRRLADYQDRAYADSYVDRLVALAATLDATRTPADARAAILTETARFLALWMAFDDVVRVADLKSRASRYERVRREVAAADGDLVRVRDFFKPGVAEVAGLLPPPLARRLVAWNRRREARGRAPFGLALTLRSDAVAGTLALRGLASLRRWRRHGSRYAEEQAAIGRWLGAIADAARGDPQCALELARCGRLIKGYGETNERGKRNLAHIVDHLLPRPFDTAAERARAIAEAREAALGDEGGRALDATMARHGAPPRPVVAQPLRFVRRQPAPGTAGRP
jgi:indolepyruvate ferredoxin oxidoreductase beta subunit